MFKYKDNLQKMLVRKSENLILANSLAEIKFDVPTVFTHQSNGVAMAATFWHAGQAKFCCLDRLFRNSAE